MKTNGVFAFRGVGNYVIVSVTLWVMFACSNVSQPSKSEQFVGHWTVGAPFSEFTTLDGKRRFYIFDDDMPHSASAFLNS